MIPSIIGGQRIGADIPPPPALATETGDVLVTEGGQRLDKEPTP